MKNPSYHSVGAVGSLRWNPELQEQRKSPVLFAQRLAHRCPVPAPKTYFADYSSQSTNFLIITERIEFASEEVCVRTRGGAARARTTELPRGSARHDPASG